MLSPALADLLAAHRLLGAEARVLAATAASGGRLPPRRARVLARALAAQHHAEEAVVLPALAAVDTTFDAAPLVADHGEVAVAARALRTATRRRDGAPAAAVRLARLVDAHHADEQRAVVPRWPLLAPTEDAAVRRGVRRVLGPTGRVRLALLARRQR